MEGKGGLSMKYCPNNISDIELLKPHNTAEVICVKCGYRYLCVWPVGTPMKKLECGKCKRIGFIITTGERRYDDFKGDDKS
jgi:hypothetical protein